MKLARIIATLVSVLFICLPLTGCYKFIKNKKGQYRLVPMKTLQHKVRNPYQKLRAKDVETLQHAKDASRRNYLGRYETDLLTRLHPLGVRVIHEDVRLRLIMPTHANFSPKSSTVNPKLMQILDATAAVMKRHKRIRSVVYGYTDSKGTDRENKALSERRSHAVIAYLESQGVENVRLITVGLGERKPVASNNTKKGRHLNRRVELTIFKGPLYY